MDEDYIRALEYGLPPTGGRRRRHRSAGDAADQQPVDPRRDPVSADEKARDDEQRSCDRSIRRLYGTPFELHVALRYLLAKRKQAFISVISLISTLGVTVGVMALVIALALMTGLQHELRDRILGVEPARLRLEDAAASPTTRPKPTSCARCRTSIGAAPAILGQGADLGGAATQAVHQLKGIDPGARAAGHRHRGGDAQRQPRRADARRTATSVDGILLGKDLAAKLGVDVGDSVSLLTPQGTLSPMGMMPRPRRLRVAGMFSLGLYEFDSHVRRSCRSTWRKRLLDKDQVDLIQLRVDDIYAAPADRRRRSPPTLGADYLTQDWADDEPVAVLGAVAREDGHLADHRPHRHGGGAEHRRVADPARDGEAPRHRHPEDDGRERAERDGDLHAAGADHRHRRDDASARVGRLRAVATCSIATS